MKNIIVVALAMIFVFSAVPAIAGENNEIKAILGTDSNAVQLNDEEMDSIKGQYIAWPGISECVELMDLWNKYRYGKKRSYRWF